MNAYRTWQSAFVFWSTMARAPAVLAMRLMAPPRARPAASRALVPVARPTVPPRQLTVVPQSVVTHDAEPVPAFAPEVDEAAEAVPYATLVEPADGAPAAVPEPETVLVAVPEKNTPALEDAVSPMPLAILAEPQAESHGDDLVEAALRPLIAAETATPVPSPLDAAIAEVVPKPPRAARRSAAASQKGRPRQGS
ncbi:hypothetical protein FHG66_12565 [Rubellimicrobium rubrum]|uniref:Uncharacterized protein n=1 Tax=Rubellimicrobium rubrum TaxID=2585369 RepID=A0A5C4MX65_9RHOB|nr:hypothetical protein [Rubellimicrobium rubrum]TNC48992.1 hypothetical protein FHG66_12565 [Rubellimicrobium rubrum]